MSNPTNSYKVNKLKNLIPFQTRHAIGSINNTHLKTMHTSLIVHSLNFSKNVKNHSLYK